MSLNQLRDIRLWLLGHWQLHPVEKNLFDLVLTAWVVGLVGIPAALLIGRPGVELACLALLFLPGRYVALRRRLARRGLLRCDWITALR